MKRQKTIPLITLWPRTQVETQALFWGCIILSWCDQWIHTLTPVSAAAAERWGAPRSQTARRERAPPGTTHPLPPLERRTRALGQNQTTLTVALQVCPLTSSCEVGLEAEVSQAPLLAHCRPGGVARPLVLRQQGETAPGEVWAQVLLTRQHAHGALNPARRDDSKVSLWQPRPRILFT